MILFAHHVAVELFGREFSPRTPLSTRLIASAASGASPGEPGRLASSTWITAASIA